MPRSRMKSCASAVSALKRSQAPGKSVGMDRHRHVVRRSAFRESRRGGGGLPARRRCRGRWLRAGCECVMRWPWSMISPASAGVMPKRMRASSVRPAPTSPAMPTISPARTSSVDAAHAAGGAAEIFQREHDLAGLAFGGRVDGGDFAADHQLDHRGFVECHRPRLVPTLSPSRRTVTRSARAKISSSRWEM